MKRHLSVLTILVLSTLVLAQTPRSLGMGGVYVPDRTAYLKNPAFAAVEFEGDTFTLPLPFGLLRLLTDPRFDPGSDSFDVITTLDQLSHPSTFIFDPATSPEEVVFSVERDAQGRPRARLSLIGGSDLILLERAESQFQRELGLALNLGTGQFRFGLRPYTQLASSLRADAGLRDLFGAGTDAGALELRAAGEVGLALDLMLAFPLTLGADNGLFFGVRASPFLGLAKADIETTASVSARELEADLMLDYSYEGYAFYSSITSGQIGYGVMGDLGLALRLPIGGGRLTTGFSVRNLGTETWQGQRYPLRGGSRADDAPEPVPEAETMTLRSEYLSFYVNTAFEAGRTPVLDTFVIAADAEWMAERLSMHLGTEIGINAGLGRLYLRGGVGRENGFVWGLGSGFKVAGFGADLALHSYTSPFTTHRSLGLSGALSFGF